MLTLEKASPAGKVKVVVCVSLSPPLSPLSFNRPPKACGDFGVGVIENEWVKVM